MFPICERCKCEILTPDCGAWTPEYRHDCRESLEIQKTLLLEALADVEDKLTEFKA